MQSGVFTVCEVPGLAPGPEVYRKHCLGSTGCRHRHQSTGSAGCPFQRKQGGGGLLTWLPTQNTLSHAFGHQSSLNRAAELLPISSNTENTFTPEARKWMKSCASLVLLNKCWSTVPPSWHNLCIVLQETAVRFPPSEGLGPSWHENDLIVCAVFVFSPVICPRVTIIVPLGTNVWHAQIPAPWDWAREHIVLCAGVMSSSRPWALVWDRIRGLQCLFSHWPLLDLSGSGALRGGLDPRKELRDASQAQCGLRPTGCLPLATSAREALAASCRLLVARR